MDTVDLEKFGYSKELADDFKTRTIGKIVLSVLFKRKKVYKQYIEELMWAIEQETGCDWFDFAFMEKKSNSIVISFLKGKVHHQKQSRISFSDLCLTEQRFDEVLTMVKEAKEIIGGN